MLPSTLNRSTYCLRSFTVARSRASTSKVGPSPPMTIIISSQLHALPARGHLVNAKTGKVLGAPDDGISASFPINPKSPSECSLLAYRDLLRYRTDTIAIG